MVFLIYIYIFLLRRIEDDDDRFACVFICFVFSFFYVGFVLFGGSGDRGEWVGLLCTDGGTYFLFDCPGQVELYTHTDSFPRIIRALENAGIRVSWC